MELTFLGTGSMVPTKDRNVIGHFLEFKGDGILIDCGEGTQRQMSIAKLNRNKVNKILITHWHGDHVAGLIGLIQTISNSENPPDITLFGPKGSKANFESLMKATLHTQNKMKVTIKELSPKGVEKFYENEDYYLECAKLEHSTPVLGYSFVEKDQRRINMKKAKKFGLKAGPEIGKLKQGKTITLKGKKIKPDDISHVEEGKKITFILDTLLCNNCMKLAKNSDLLVCEATYHSDLKEKAEEHKHMSAKDAASIASNSNVKKLILTHFSQRYRHVGDLLEEAKTIFPETQTANDFMKVKLK